MAEEIIDANVADIKVAIEAKKAILGTKRTIKALRSQKVAKIYCTSNTPADVMETISYYSGLQNVEFVKLDHNNEQLGLACRKPYVISVVAVAK